MNYEKIEQLTSNLRIILNLIRDYKQDIERLQNDWAKSQDEKRGNLILTQITNCEAQINFNEKQYKQTINQINEHLS